MEVSSEIGSLFSPERKAVRRKVWRMAVPVMLANITIPLVGLVDTAVMGHFDSAHYIGAVAMGSFMFSLMTIVFGFQRMAVTGLIAQAKGNGHQAEHKTAHGDRTDIIGLIKMTHHRGINKTHQRNGQIGQHHRHGNPPNLPPHFNAFG